MKRAPGPRMFHVNKSINLVTLIQFTVIHDDSDTEVKSIQEQSLE